MNTHGVSDDGSRSLLITSCKARSLKRTFNSQAGLRLILSRLCLYTLRMHTLVHLQRILSLQLVTTRSGPSSPLHYPLAIQCSHHWSPQLAVTPCRWLYSLLWGRPVRRCSSMLRRSSNTPDNRHSTKHMYLRPI